MLTLVHGSLLLELAIMDTLYGYVPLVNHLNRDKKWKLWHLGLIRSKDLLTLLFGGETNNTQNFSSPEKITSLTLTHSHDSLSC